MEKTDDSVQIVFSKDMHTTNVDRHCSRDNYSYIPQSDGGQN